MKTRLPWIVVTTACALVIAGNSGARSQGSGIALASGFSSPIVVRGTSGGAKQTPDCGKIAAAPNHVIQMKNDFPYLRFSLQSAGSPTLLIVEPSGRRTCVLSDSYSQGTIQSSGFWKKGPYSVYIGDRAGGRNQYTLSITQKQD
jgi:hypothetical protein